jgi:hypothetical protein
VSLAISVSDCAARAKVRVQDVYEVGKDGKATKTGTRQVTADYAYLVETAGKKFWLAADDITNDFLALPEKTNPGKTVGSITKVGLDRRAGATVWGPGPVSEAVLAKWQKAGILRNPA